MILTELETDALQEAINIGVGHAAGSINELVGAHVTLHVPELVLLTLREASEHVAALGWSRLSTVQLRFSGELKGNAALIFPSESAIQLVSLLTGEEGCNQDVDGMRQSTLEEVGNIVLNGVMGSISNLLGQSISFCVPYYSESGPLEAGLGLGSVSERAQVIFARVRFNVAERELEGEILIFLEVKSFENLIAALNSYMAQV
jgi:chemotaxis protein CheC